MLNRKRPLAMASTLGRLFFLLMAAFFTCGAAVPQVDSAFHPPPVPKVDYSEFNQNAPLELVVAQTTTYIEDMAVSPDGKLIAVASPGNIYLRNHQGMLLSILPVPSVMIRQIAFAPSGKAIVIGGYGGVALMRLDGTLVWQQGKLEDVHCIAVSRTGRLIASGNQNHLNLWSLDGTSLGDIPVHEKAVTAVAISPDGNTIATGSEDKTIKLWGRDGTLISTLRGHRGAITAIAFRPDGKVIASVSDEGKDAVLWGAGGRLLKRLSMKGFDYGMSSLAFSPDGHLLVTGGIDGISLWDAHGDLLRSNDHSPYHISVGASVVAFHPDGQSIISIGGAEDEGVFFWDQALSNTHFEKFFNIFEEEDTSQDKSPVKDAFLDLYRREGHSQVDTTEQDWLDQWVSMIADALQKQENDRAIINGYCLVDHGERAITGHSDGTIRQWTKEGEQVQRIKAHDGSVNGIACGDGDRLIASASDDGSVRLWDRSGHEQRVLQIGGKVRQVAFSPDASKLVVVTKEGAISLWSTAGALLWSSRLGGSASKIAFSPDGRQFAVALHEKGIEVFRADGTSHRTLAGHTVPTEAMRLSRDGKFLLTKAIDRKIWDLATGAALSYYAKGGEWIVYSSDGYFAASQNPGALFTLVKGFDTYQIDQLAYRYNRPDILLQRLGSQDRALIAYFHKLYVLRLKRAGLDEANMAQDDRPPRVTLLSSQQDGKFVDVDFEVSAVGSPLKSYNVYVNGVPLYGAGGKAISGNNPQYQEHIELTSGKNLIEVAATDEAGMESLRLQVDAEYDKEVPSALYYIGFGVSQYRDADLNLDYAAKDVADLGKLFANYVTPFYVDPTYMSPGDYRMTMRMRRIFQGNDKDDANTEVHIRTYLNDQVTAQNIAQAKAFLQGASVDDIFVLFIAGHGVHDTDPDSTYYFLTYNTDIHHLPETAANFGLIENLLQGIAPRRKLFLMDTCESGLVDDDVEEGFYAMAESRGIKPRASRAIRVQLRDPQRGQHGRILLEKNSYIYNDVHRRSGAVVFSSSKGSEFSYESGTIENGFFTQAIIDALTGSRADRDGDGYLSIGDLRDYVSKEVAEQTDGYQHPTIDRNNLFMNLLLPEMGDQPSP